MAIILLGKFPGTVLYMIKHCCEGETLLYICYRNIYLHFYTYFIGNKMFVIVFSLQYFPRIVEKKEQDHPKYSLTFCKLAEFSGVLV